MALFLPFTPVGERTEKKAIEVKAALGFGPYASVDPFEVLPVVPACLLTATEIERLPGPIRDVLLGQQSGTWSAVGLGVSPATGEEIIILNPNHHEHRQRVSLMEEIVHIKLCHPRVSLQLGGDAVGGRSFCQAVEDEAFCVGAACLIPYQGLFNRIKAGKADPGELATEFNVSRDYVEYRIKRAGLFAMWKKSKARTTA